MYTKVYQPSSLRVSALKMASKITLPALPEPAHLAKVVAFFLAPAWHQMAMELVSKMPESELRKLIAAYLNLPPRGSSFDRPVTVFNRGTATLLKYVADKSVVLRVEHAFDIMPIKVDDTYEALKNYEKAVYAAEEPLRAASLAAIAARNAAAAAEAAAIVAKCEAANAASAAFRQAQWEKDAPRRAAAAAAERAAAERAAAIERAAAERAAATKRAAEAVEAAKSPVQKAADTLEAFVKEFMMCNRVYDSDRGHIRSVIQVKDRRDALVDLCRRGRIAMELGATESMLEALLLRDGVMKSIVDLEKSIDFGPYGTSTWVSLTQSRL